MAITAGGILTSMWGINFLRIYLVAVLSGSSTISSVFFKKYLLIISSLTLAAPLLAFAQGTGKIGTVDMQRAFKDYNKTKDAEVKINEAKNAAKKEYDDRAEAYKKALDEINNLNKQLESPALSADKKTGMAKER